MKFMLLTAAALIAAPAIAQDTTTPAPTDQTMPGEPAATGTMTPPATGSDMSTTTTTTADPAMSQPSTSSSTMTTTTPSTTTPSTDMQSNGTQPMTSQPMTSPPMASGDMSQQGMSASGGMGQMTKGGYMPSAPALSGPAQPGQQVTFRPAPSPSEAFPPPAPKASYPICKPGQYDGCMQRGGK